MSGMQTFIRSTLIILFALAVVASGAEELRRKTRKISVSDASRRRMMQQLNPDMDFKKGQLAERAKKEEQASLDRAQLREDSPEEKEHLDPTGLRGLLHKLLP